VIRQAIMRHFIEVVVKWGEQNATVLDLFVDASRSYASDSLLCPFFAVSPTSTILRRYFKDLYLKSKKIPTARGQAFVLGIPLPAIQYRERALLWSRPGYETVSRAIQHVSQTRRAHFRHGCLTFIPCSQMSCYASQRTRIQSMFAFLTVGVILAVSPPPWRVLKLSTTPSFSAVCLELSKRRSSLPES
jgi:hypothetical protein